MRLYSLILILVLICIQRSTSREIKNDDIRDAIVSLVQIIKTTENKLERHELRERNLGDQIKKQLIGLEKQYKSIDPLKGTISRLDERLSSVETILIQKEEREKQQMKKTEEIMESLKNSLKTWSDTMMNMVQKEIKSIPKPKIDNSNIENKITKLEENLMKKIDAVTSNMNGIKEITNGIKDSQSKIQAECKRTGLDEKLVIKQINNTENLLSKYEKKLIEQKINVTNLQKEILPLGEIAATNIEWHNKMNEALDKQHQIMQTIQKSLTNQEQVVKLIPTLQHVEKSINQTVETLREIQYDIISNSEKGITKLSTGLSEIIKQNEATQNTLGKGVTGCNEVTDKVHEDVLKSCEKISTEMQALHKLERVMIQTADNVMDTKRRIDYGILQILSEIGDKTKVHNKELNTTINLRFDDIEISIVENQRVALENLNKKIEQEMSQVWRQIGIMYQQLTAGNTALDRLQAQTDLYVNGTITTMDSMEGKVGTITKRMLEVDDNLNFLLGRLSLVTQEFNQIKVGLGTALEDIKNSFLTVQSKIKDAGPGPHNISSSEVL